MVKQHFLDLFVFFLVINSWFKLKIWLDVSKEGVGFPGQLCGDPAQCGTG